jgi:HPt (histidine-containing phosphotransfer) domain-containing protein
MLFSYSLFRISVIMESLTIPADCDSVVDLCSTILNYSFGTSQFRSAKLLCNEYLRLSPMHRIVSCIDDNNEALLRCALAECDSSILASFVDPATGLSLLALASRKASPHCIRLLVDHGCQVRGAAVGAAPALHVALWAGRGDNVNELLARGADPGELDGTGTSAIELTRSHPILSPQFLHLLENPSRCTAALSQPRYLCLSDPQARHRLRRACSLHDTVNGEKNVLGTLHCHLPFEFSRIEGNWGKLSPKEYRRARNSSESGDSTPTAFIEHNPEIEGWCILSNEGEEFFISSEAPDTRPISTTCPILDPRLYDTFLPRVRDILSSLVHIALEPSQSLSVQSSVARIIGSVIRDCPPPIIKFLFNTNPSFNDTLSETYTILKSPEKAPIKSREGCAAREDDAEIAASKDASIRDDPSGTAHLFARFACGLLQSTPLLSVNGGESSAAILQSVASVLSASCFCILPLLRELKFGPILTSLLCCGVPSLQKVAKDFEKKFKSVLELGSSEIQRELSNLVNSMSTHKTIPEFLSDLEQLRDLINAGKLSWFDVSHKSEGKKSLLSCLCSFLIDFHQDNSKHHEAQLFQSAFVEVFCEYSDGLRGSSPEIGNKRKAELDYEAENAAKSSQGLKATRSFLRLLRDLFGTGLENLSTDIPRLTSHSYQSRRGLRSLRDAIELKCERDDSGRSMFAEGCGRVLSAELGCSSCLLEQWCRTELGVEWFSKPFLELHYVLWVRSASNYLHFRVFVMES